jgi:hypothetical protein
MLSAFQKVVITFLASGIHGAGALYFPSKSYEEGEA